jgi:hypothetical protein
VYIADPVGIAVDPNAPQEFLKEVVVSIPAALRVHGHDEQMADLQKLDDLLCAP